MSFTAKDKAEAARRSFLRYADLAIPWILWAAAVGSILIVALIFGFIFREAAPFFVEQDLSHLLNDNWRPKSMLTPSFGLYALIAGSAMVTLLACLIAVPLGIAAAVYIAEVAKSWEREILKPFIELLAAIPSVVLGFLGMTVLAPIVKAVFGLPTGLTALTGAIILALMALPTIVSIAEDAIRSVPKAYREASLALGAKRMQTTWRVIVPAAIPGITAAVMLGMGRVVGETMVVLMVTGNTPRLTFSPFDPVRTMTATIAAEMGETEIGSAHYHALFLVGIVLLLTTFTLNFTAIRVFKRYGGRA